MDADLTAAEIVFAQKLASGEPTTRRRALKKLQTWVTDCTSDGKEFTMDDCLKLWKGMYYCMWMQDKMLVQEELADNLGQLINHFGSDEQVFLFVESFFATMAREWHGIDRWRLDKFLMLLRRIVRFLFAWLSEHQWSSDLVDEFYAVCSRTVLSTDHSIPDGVKFHFASVFLDELDLAGAETLDRDQVIRMLQPFIDLLANPKTSNYVFNSVIEEIFVSILHQFSDELSAKEDDDEEATGAKAAGIEFDYAKIGELLFQVGKAKQMRGDRRKRIYTVVKKFNMAANGADPMSMDLEDQDDCSDIDENDIDSAARRLLRRENQAKIDRERFRKDRKRKHVDSDDDEGDNEGGENDEGDHDDNDDDEDGSDVEAPPPPKITRKAKNKKKRASDQNKEAEEPPKAARKPKSKKKQRLSNEKSNVKKRKQKKVKSS